ncbi:hypothetical protein [Marinitoga sp. 1135]|uniref:hypothetical protein n=1 Tax=Marinitoga sp. 1135 TaxID=1643333 RepID=UPI0015863105|nr:hypothetical protein [Marinitoga sp. 1135]
MTYVDFIRWFWKQLRYLPIDAQEGFLFLALLDELNEYWLMTGKREWVKLRASALMDKSRLKKDTFYRARNKLKQLGLIDFKEGKNRNDLARYFIPDSATQTLGQTLPEILPATLGQTVSQTLPANNNIDIDIEKDIEKNDIVPQQVEGPQQTPYQKIVELYHAYCPSLPKVRVLNETRKKYIRARWKEHPDLKFWENYFKSVEESDFLTGRANYGNRDPFIADLEWLMRPNNFAKVIEGKYKNRTETKKEEDFYITFPEGFKT